MADLEHIGNLITDLLNALNIPILWVNDNECTKEQVIQILEECRLELALAEKECEDLIRADNK